MKAIVCTKYGPPEVLRIKEIEKPVPKDDEVLVRVKATTVTQADTRVRGFRVPLSYWVPARLALGLTKPKKPVLGTELAGVIEDVGRDVQNFKVGDQVFALTGHDLGCYAEYRCVPEGGIISRKPVNLSFEEAAAIPMGGLTALHFLREGKVGERAEGIGLWCIGEHRNLRCAAGQASRGGGDRGVQHRQPGPGTFAGSGQGHRLHQGGLLQGWRHLRCGARYGWQEPPLSQHEVVEEGGLLSAGASTTRSEPAHALGNDDHAAIGWWAER